MAGQIFPALLLKLKQISFHTRKKQSMLNSVQPRQAETDIPLIAKHRNNVIESRIK